MTPRDFRGQVSVETLQHAAQLLSRARRPVCIAGRGLVQSGACAALLALCERLPRLRVASTPGAKGVIPHHHARWLGVWGFCGNPAARAAVEQGDVVLIVGTRLLEQATGGWNKRLQRGLVIRIDIDRAVSLGYNIDEVLLVGDARHILQGLLQLLLPVADDPKPEPHALAVEAGPPLGSGANLLHPGSLVKRLSQLAPLIPVCADAGNSMCWAIEHLERVRPKDFYVSVDWGTMGFALPAAIGVALARGTSALALTGDGSMAMAGGDLHTAVELGLPVIVIVLNDSGAGMVDAGCKAWFGPEKVPSQRYRNRINFVPYAQGLGAYTATITTASQFEAELLSALDRPTPSLLDVHTDPDAAPASIRDRVKGLVDPRLPPATIVGGGMC